MKRPIFRVGDRVRVLSVPDGVNPLGRIVHAGRVGTPRAHYTVELDNPFFDHDTDDEVTAMCVGVDEMEPV